MRSNNRLRAPHPVSTKKHERGAMLLEALIGLLIFSMGILAMIGLQATAVRMNTGSKERADAAFLANQVISRMWTENRATIENYAHSAAGGGVLSFANRDRTDCTPNGVASTSGVVNSWLTTLGSFLPGATAARQQIVVTSTGATPDRVFTVIVGICWPADDGTWHNHVAQARVNES